MTEPTDCPTCKDSKRECDDSAAMGMDGCCITCDEIGRAPNRRRLTLATLSRESHADSPHGDGFVETRGDE